MAREAHIQQALENLRRLYERGEIPQMLYERKKQELLTQLPPPQPLPPELTEFEKYPRSQHPGGAAPPARLSSPKPFASPQKDSQEDKLAVGQMIRERYRIKGYLGEGTIGQIFLVEDTRFGGEYALKRLRTSLIDNETEMKHWVREFYKHQELKHPGVVRTYLIDEDASPGILFYLREYVPGDTLQELFDRAKQKADVVFTAKEALRIFQSLVNLVREAHDNEFYLLDLNPSNIVFPTYVDDSPVKLLDFHFTGHLGKTTQHLNLKSRKTLYYTAPELVSDGGRLPTVESNIYALGALLYQMLTGSLPVIMAMPPSEVNPALPKEIDKVLQNAMHPQHIHRYHDLSDMVDDLYDAFTPSSSSPTRAATPPPQSSGSQEQPPRWAADLSKPKPSFQNPFALENSQRAPAQTPPRSEQTSQFPSSPGSFEGPARPIPPYHAQFPSLPEGSSSRQESSQSPSPSQPQSRPSSPPGSYPEQTTRIYGKSSTSTTSRPGSFSQRTALPSQRSSISNADRIARLRSGTPKSPDTPRYRPEEGSRRPPVRAHSVNTPTRVMGQRSPLGRGTTPRTPDLSIPDDLPRTPPKQKLLGHQKGLTSLCISPDDRFLVSASFDGTVCLWDTQSWYSLYTITVEAGKPENLCWNPRQELFAYSDAQGNVLIHDLNQQRWRWKITTGTTCRGLAWHPASLSLLVALADGTLQWWSLETEQPVAQTTYQTTSVSALALHSQRQYVLSGDSAGQITCWRGRDQNPIWQPPSLESGINVLTCFPTERKVIVGSHDGKLHLLDLVQKTTEHTWSAHHKGVRDIVIPPHERWFASCSNDRRIHLWRFDDVEPFSTLSARQGALRALALNSTGEWMASGGEGASICIWDTSSWS